MVPRSIDFNDDKVTVLETGASRGNVPRNKEILICPESARVSNVPSLLPQ